MMNWVCFLLLFFCLVCFATCEINYDSERLSEDEESESGSGASDFDEEMQDEGSDRTRRTNEDSSLTGSGMTSGFMANKTNDAETAEKKSEVQAGEKPKSLTSSTVVSVPAGVIAKLSGDGNTSASLIDTPDQQSASITQDTATTINDEIIPSKETEGDVAQKRGNFLKTKSIGPMETLEIKMEGVAQTKNNFTKNTVDEDEEMMPKQTKQVNFIQNKDDSEAVGKPLLVPAAKKAHVHKHHGHGRKHKKSFRRSKVAFPKIILYQGPLSKALERMLYSKTSSAKKRSQIERLLRKQTKSLNKKVYAMNDEEGEDENEVDDVPDEKQTGTNERKSNVQQKAVKKYEVKGFVDNVRVGQKSAEKKTSIATGKINKTEESEKRRKTGEIEAKASSAVSNVDNIMRQHVNNFIKETTTGLGKTLPKQVADSKKKKNNKFVATGPPKIKVVPKKNNEDDEEETAVSGNDDGEKAGEKAGEKDTASGEEKEAREKVGEDNDGKDKESEDEKDEKDEKDKETKVDEDEKEKDTGKENKDKEAEKEEAEKEEAEKEKEEEESEEEEEGSTPNLSNNNPDEPPPTPVVEEPATNPETPLTPPSIPNYPSPSLLNLPTTPTNEEANDLPQPVQNPPPSIGQQVPDAVSPEQQQPEEEVNPELPKQQGGGGDPSYLQDDIMTQLDLNSQSIDTLVSRVSSLESKEKELESAMGSISEGLERIELKLDSQQHKPAASSLPLPQGQLPEGIPNKRPSLLRNQFILNLLKKIYRSYMKRVFPTGPQLLSSGGQGSFQQDNPKILKEIFIPLPPRGSLEAQAIEQGKMFSSPVLSKLPLPIRKIVSSIFRQQLRKEDGLSGLPPPAASLEPDEPAKEHDIDKLELELGRIPISRHGTFRKFNNRAPKLLFFSKAPRFFDLMSKPCDAPCENGGRCLGNNVCRCYHGYTGPQCQHQIRPTLVEIIGPSPMQFTRPGHATHQISLPFAPMETGPDEEEEEEEDTKQRTMGHVDQSKLVNILRKFTLPFREVEESGGAEPPFKRYRIPRHYDNRYRYNRGGYYRY